MKVAGLPVMALAAVLCLAACGGAPTAPTPSPGDHVAPPPPPPPAATDPVISRIEIEGPEVVALGETTTFRLVAHLTDRSTRDVTAEAVWTPGWGDVVVITRPGEVRGVVAGETQIEARLQGHWADKRLMVLPAGTYRLTGQVTETDSRSTPIAGAAVSVRSRSGLDTTLITDHFGHYRVYGVAGSTTVHVSKSGYESAGQSLNIDDHDTLDVELPLRVARMHVAGVYTLTVQAASHCAPALPEQALRRVYTATVEQDGAALEVTLTGASMLPGFDRFGGRAEPRRAVFDLTWYDGDGPVVIERVPSIGLLALDGIAIVTGTGTRLSGRVPGTWRVFATDWFRESPTAYCPSEEHEFVLTR